MTNLSDSKNSNNVMEWRENILTVDKSIWSILVCATSLNYVHKILGEKGENVYLVSDHFYTEAIRSIKLKKEERDKS